MSKIITVVHNRFENRIAVALHPMPGERGDPVSCAINMTFYGVRSAYLRGTLHLHYFGVDPAAAYDAMECLREAFGDPVMFDDTETEALIYSAAT